MRDPNLTTATAELPAIPRIGSGDWLDGTVKYKTIVADPPWCVKAGPRSLHDPNEKSRPLEYPTMTVDEISALQIPADDDAHLYLWTINAYIEQTYAIARAWGFKPSTLLTWCKKPKGRGLGGTFSTATEFVLFARRGTLAAKQRCDRNWWEWPRGAHSAKPEAFQDMVESVSPGPYLELFARRTRLGWHTWGNQALCHVNLVPSNESSSGTASERKDKQ
jgi:N6-adenosine-specific RNA methylase IME4